MDHEAKNSFLAFRSDSGPIGPIAAKLDDAIGFDGFDERELLDITEQAILSVGLGDLKRIDRGGYGVVFQAKDTLTGNRRAVKVLLHHKNPARLKIFRRECRVLNATEMPSGIAPQFHGAYEPTKGQPFLILEWIVGQKLSDWLNANPKLPMRDRESLCRLIFESYSRLHQHNLIHRDVSLGNIMISNRSVRLIDFGGGGRAAPGYNSKNTLTQVPTTEAFVTDAVYSGKRRPTIADEVHAVAKVCFSVLTSQLAFGKSKAECKRLLKSTGVLKEIAEIVLAKMQEPPQRLAMKSRAKEF